MKKHIVKKSSDKQINNVVVVRETDYNISIENFTHQNCKHQMPYGHGYHGEICNDMCSQIVEYLTCDAETKKKYKEITPDTYKLFFQYITKKMNSYYSDVVTCLKKNKKNLPFVISMILKEYIPSYEIFELLVKTREYDICYKNITTKLDEKYCDIIIDNRLKYSFSNDDSELVHFLVNHIDHTESMLYKLCGCSNETLAFIVSGIIEKYSDNLSNDLMDAACGALPYTKHIVKALLNRNISLTSEHLVIVCSKCSVEAIDFFLQTSRMIITSAHFKALVDSEIYTKLEEPQGEYNYYRNRNQSHCLSNGYNDEKIELLIKYGYQPTYDDVVYAAKKQFEIPGIERFNIDLNKDFLELCWDYDFYPTYKFKCIQPEMVELQKLCCTKRLKDIKYCIKNNGLVPDRRCMENASRYKNNNAIYDHLKVVGGKVTYKCVKNCAQECINNSFLMNLINDYEIQMNNEFEKLNSRITYLENELAIKHTNLLTNPSENNNNDGNNTTIVNNEIIDSDDNFSQDMDDNKNEMKDIVHIKVINIPIDDNKIKEIQKKYKNKTLPNKTLMEVLQLDKGKKLSYSDVKKCIINKIQSEKWICGDNGNLFELPQDIKNKLNLNNDGVIKFDELDKLVCMFYN